jgi:hypothetical protein
MCQLEQRRRHCSAFTGHGEDVMEKSWRSAVVLTCCCIASVLLVGCGGGDKAVYLQPETATDEAAAPPADSQDDLTDREREFAEREAALAAREAVLEERERRSEKPPARARQQPTAAAVAPSATPTPVPTPMPTPTPAPIDVTVASGTVVTVEFLDKLSSHESLEGQEFTVRVVEPVSVPQGIAIPAGSTITGKVLEAKPAKKVGGSSRLNVEFTTLRLPAGDTAPFHATFSTKGKSATGRDVGIIAGAAAGGAILGNQVIDDDGGTKGALIGAAAGAIAASQTRAKPVEIATGTVTNLELTEPIDLEIQP